MTFTLPQILVAILVLSLFWGGYGYRAAPGAWAPWSPLGFTDVVLLILWVTHHLV